jgi:hypothetical protein
LATIATNSEGQLELGGVRRYFQPSFVLDSITADMDNGAGLIRKHDEFLVRDFGLFGMSGGPAFDAGGQRQGSATIGATQALGLVVKGDRRLGIKSVFVDRNR